MGRQNRLLILVVAGALAIAALPAVVSAAGGTFVDDDTSIFEADIEWLAASGVTKGCDAANGLFCPDDNVTRGQMAAFMKRFAGYLGAEDGVVAEADTAGDADTVDGQHASAFLGKTDKAADADKLDGLSHEAFLKVGDKAADSDLLDGRNWSAFLSYDDDIPALQTMTGAFAAAAPSGSFGTAVISFFPQLRSNISEANTHYIDGAYTSECPGPGQALAGHFCAYEEFNNSMTFQGKGFHDPGSGNLTGGAYEEGTIIYFQSSSSGGNVRGTWAVTAPLVIIPFPLSEQAGVGDSPTTSGG